MYPAEVERAVGLIDGIIQEDAFKAMLDDFAAKNHEVFDPTADENKLGMNFHFPSFVWNAMSSGWMIRNVIKMETYYQKQCAQ